MDGCERLLRPFRHPIWLASVAFGSLVIAGALERNLVRLHAPQVDGAGYNTMRWFVGQPDLDSARAVWSTAWVELAPFGVRSATWIIRWHVLWDSVFVIAAIALVLRIRSRPGVVGERWPTLLLGALVLDQAGNLLELANTWWWQSWAAIIAGVVWIAALALYAIGLAMAAWRYRTDLIDACWRTPATHRVLGLVALVLVILPFAGRIGVQTQDVVERWFVNGDWTRATVPLVLFVAYVLIVHSMRYLAEPGDDAAWSTRRVAASVAALLVAGGVMRFMLGWGYGLLTLGAGALLVLLGSQGPRQVVTRAETDVPWARGAIGALPAASVAVVLVRSYADALAVTDTIVQIRYLLLVAAGSLVMIVTAYVVCSRPAVTPALSHAQLLRIVLRSVAGGLLIALLLAGRSAEAARTLGTFGVVFLTLAAAAACAAVLRSSLSPTSTPLMFVRCGFSRTPVILILVVWVASTTFFNGLTNAGGVPMRYYDARLIERVVPAPTAQSEPGAPCVVLSKPDLVDPAVLNRFCDWIESNPAPADDGVTPLIMVTASGGGVRAAAWTAAVLDCVLFRALPDCEGAGPDRWSNLFAANGASGGSVGIASVAAERLTTHPGTPVSPRWLDRNLEGDVLAPTLARAVAYDGLLGLFGINVGHDRTWALEDAWAEPWDGIPLARCEQPHETLASIGLLSLDATDECRLPLLMFNGTDVATGCRVNVAPLDINAALAGDDIGTLDLTENLAASTDVPLFTAAFLSARFPFVSSSGRIDGRVAAGGQVLNVVDGGYGENTGTAQMAELWKQLESIITAWNVVHSEQRVRPVLIEIVNGEGNLSDEESDVGEQIRSDCAPQPSVVGDLLRPAEAILGVEKARDRTLRRELRTRVAMFGEASITGSVITLTMAEHPGRTLPLGWALSADTLDDLRNQLELDSTRRVLVRLGSVLPDETNE